METSDYYALGIPIFLLMVGAEIWLSKRRGQENYKLLDTISNLGCAMGVLLVGIFLGLMTIAAYEMAYTHFALVHYPEGSVIPWILAFVDVDFFYYWFHRFGHKINLFWAIHSVHHQSEEYNFAVGLRQPWFSDLYALFFYWPLPFLGVPDLHFFVAVAFLSLYQTLLHTKLIQKPGVWGWIFNTPSHHRVHHGRNEKYLDCNFGATLIIWDRLFGTFQAEEETPVYGTVRPLQSWSAFEAQTRTFSEIFQLARKAKKPIDAFKVWWMPPGWLPEGAEDTLSTSPEPLGPRLRVNVSIQESRYILLHFIALCVGGVVLLSVADGLPLWKSVPGVFFLLFCLAVLGGLADKKEWAGKMESIRLSAMGLFAVILLWNGFQLGGLILFLSIVSFWFIQSNKAPSHSSV